MVEPLQIKEENHNGSKPSSFHLLIFHWLTQRNKIVIIKKKYEFWLWEDSNLRRLPTLSGEGDVGLVPHRLCTKVSAFGRIVVQCPRPRRLSLDKDDVGNL
ncbi:unnamed protein product [Spirodela intermedia]|uniref:Uncharacterized protein n=1 Tax=Spirodela intermedia TaxID=51605 RepID=A0A7I8IH51_SPIIN|nr:unnamed protein product [Spirodela intermedia]CAA6656624.1 unnamed protein product [Spirodela intermedia]